MGGDISVESKLGHGSCFSFHFPSKRREFLGETEEVDYFTTVDENISLHTLPAIEISHSCLASELLSKRSNKDDYSLQKLNQFKNPKPKPKKKKKKNPIPSKTLDERNYLIVDDNGYNIFILKGILFRLGIRNIDIVN
jgi:hypothetical protein